MTATARASDVTIVGGGPVGLGTAIACRLRGLDVTVLDARRPPIDKACGEGIMPSGVTQLRSWGVDLGGLGAPFRAIRYSDRRHDVIGALPQAGLGARRTELHERLRCRAQSLGVVLRWGERVQRLERVSGRYRLHTGRQEFVPRWVVGADGLHSHVRRWAGLDAGSGRLQRFGLRRHVSLRAPGEGSETAVHVLWTAGVEAYLTPIGRDRLGVAFLFTPALVSAPDPAGGSLAPLSRRVRGERKPFDTLLARFPELQAALAGAEPCSRARGAGPLHHRARTVARANLALVGDAAGYLDAITGEGLALGFAQSEALARSLAAETLADYPRAVRRGRRHGDRLTRLTLLLTRYPRLRARALAAFSRNPSLFERLLRAHAAPNTAGRHATLDTIVAIGRLALLLPRRSSSRLGA